MEIAYVSSGKITFLFYGHLFKSLKVVLFAKRVWLFSLRDYTPRNMMLS